MVFTSKLRVGKGGGLKNGPLFGTTNQEKSPEQRRRDKLLWKHSKNTPAGDEHDDIGGLLDLQNDSDDDDTNDHHFHHTNVNTDAFVPLNLFGSQPPPNETLFPMMNHHGSPNTKMMIATTTTTDIPITNVPQFQIPSVPTLSPPEKQQQQQLKHQRKSRRTLPLPKTSSMGSSSSSPKLRRQNTSASHHSNSNSNSNSTGSQSNSNNTKHKKKNTDDGFIDDESFFDELTSVDTKSTNQSKHHMMISPPAYKSNELLQNPSRTMTKSSNNNKNTNLVSQHPPLPPSQFTNSPTNSRHHYSVPQQLQQQQQSYSSPNRSSLRSSIATASLSSIPNFNNSSPPNMHSTYSSPIRATPRPQLRNAATTATSNPMPPPPPTPSGGTQPANYLSFVNGDWATIDKENNTTIIKSPDGKTIQRPKVMMNKNSNTTSPSHKKDERATSSSHILKPIDDSSSDDDSDDVSRNTKDTGDFLSDDDLAIEIDDESSDDDDDEVKSISKSRSINSKLIDSSDDDDDDNFRRRPVARMTSGQLRQWDGFHNEVSSLVKIAMPNNVHQVSVLLKQFDGREAELIHTLQTMCRRIQSSTIPGNYKASKQSKIHHSRGAISTEAKDSVRRTSTMSGRKIDAIARIAAASTLDDQTKAVKPEYVVDENQYDHSNNHHTNTGNDSDDDDDDDQSFWQSKISLTLSFDSKDKDDDDEDENDDFNPRRHIRDEDPSQIYTDDEDDGSYDEDEGDTYFDEGDEDEENESNMYDDDDDDEEEVDSPGSSASWDHKHGNNTDQWR